MVGTDDLIKKAREYAKLAEKATPGPWRVNTRYDLPSIDGPEYSVIGGECDDSGATAWLDGDKADLALAAAAPDMAQLIAKMADALEKSPGNEDQT